MSDLKNSVSNQILNLKNDFIHFVFSMATILIQQFFKPLILVVILADFIFWGYILHEVDSQMNFCVYRNPFKHDQDQDRKTFQCPR